MLRRGEFVFGRAPGAISLDRGFACDLLLTCSSPTEELELSRDERAGTVTSSRPLVTSLRSRVTTASLSPMTSFSFCWNSSSSGWSSSSSSSNSNSSS